MLALNYNKEVNVYEVFTIKMCKCGMHYCKELEYASSNLNDCIKRIKGAMEDCSLNTRKVSP